MTERWWTNCGAKHAELHRQFSTRGPKGGRVIVKEPRATESFTVEQLQEMGIVAGLYEVMETME